MTAGPHPTLTFNAVSPDVAACKVIAHVGVYTKDRMRPMPCIVCGQSTVLTFVSGCLMYKQEVIFLFVDIQRKVWESQGEERYKGLCESESHKE